MAEYLNMEKIVEEFNKTDFAKELHVFRAGWEAGNEAGIRRAAEHVVTSLQKAYGMEKATKIIEAINGGKHDK